MKSSSKGQTAAAPSQPAAPEPGFLAKIEEIIPNDQIQPPRRLNHQQGFFFPPNRSDALITRSECLLRYKDRVFREVVQNDHVRGQVNVMQHYRAATVFSQATSTDHLLTVPFDARRSNVSERDHDWKNLGFEYKFVPNVGTGTCASVEFIGENEDLPALVPGAWERLIPQPYRYQRTDDDGNPKPSGTTFAGLIGSLPLLVALAAFSACPGKLKTTLETSRSPEGRWVPHNYTTGRQSRPTLCLDILLS